MGVSGGWAEKVIWAESAVFRYFGPLGFEKVVFSSSFFGFLPEKPVFPVRVRVRARKPRSGLRPLMTLTDRI